MTWTYRTSQPAKVDGQAAQEMSGQDKVAAAAQPQTKEDQEANYSAEIAEGQQEKQGQHKYENVSLVCADAWYSGCFASNDRPLSAIACFYFYFCKIKLQQLADVDADCSCKGQLSMSS